MDLQGCVFENVVELLVSFLSLGAAVAFGLAGKSCKMSSFFDFEPNTCG